LESEQWLGGKTLGLVKLAMQILLPAHQKSVKTKGIFRNRKSKDKHCNDQKMKKDSNFKFNVVFFLNKFEFENYINIINHKQYIEYG
jgi:hypothetical protein